MADGSLFLFDASGEGRVLVTPGDPPKLLFPADQPRYADVICFSGRVSRGDGESDIWARLAPGAPLPERLAAVERRVLADLLGIDVFTRSGIAYQMMNLTVRNKFCGVCGAAMRDHERERARECPECRSIVYPSLSPAVIVAVEKDGMLLMGHNVNFPEGRYSVLAGFVEPGETLEQAVEREVYEESRVRIRNIRYFESQPWPFPSSMMIGFQAEWESGDPQPDGQEIADVRWITPDSLPDLPHSVSISRRLINDWLRRREPKEAEFAV